MFKQFLFKILFFMPFICSSQELLINTLNRNITSLNGQWNYIVDPYETGFYNYRSQAYDEVDKSSHSAFYNNYHAQNKQELVEYDFDKSPTMTVPGDWNSQKENLFYYEGAIWLKKSFDYDLKENKRHFVYFGAINYKAEVYLNGKKLGIHEGGFTPFNFEVSSIIKSKDNFLVVKVDAIRRKDAVPTINTDWFNYGGITRDVLLIEEPKEFIQNYTIQLKKGEKNTISGFVTINNFENKDGFVSIKIPELKVNYKGKTDADGKINFEIINKKIEYWSPESPKLYEVSIGFKDQVLKDNIGFRTIETQNEKILLNGKQVFLRGISIHEENDKGGRANSEVDAMRLLTWAKELGCNFVRLAHYPHNENIIKLADKIGLMVWEEIPVYWTIDFTNMETLGKAKNQLTEVISRDKNRASVIIWSMANETPPSKFRNSFIIDLVNHTKTLDNSRLISAALETHSENGVSVVNDSLGNYLDIIAFNQYRGWYGGTLDDAPEAKWSINFNKPVVVSEFGGGAKAGMHGDKKERWTEEYQEYLYIQNLKMIEKIPNFSGLSPWILVDFRSPKRLLPGIQDGYNRKGLISNEGIKKKAFFVLQNFYNKLYLIK